MAATAPVRVEQDGDIAVIVIDSPPVNATSQAVRAGLTDALAAISHARAAVLVCAGNTFVAGGDMSEFDSPAQPPHLPDVVQAIEDSPVPVIAAMHGNVLGGGFEIALGCAWRIAAKGTRFGLPEVNVGLIPGAGGTQRAPRLIGMDAAIEMACSGRIFDAESMLALGGIDAIAEGGLREAAIGFARTLPERPLAVSRRSAQPLPPEVLSERRAAIIKRARGQVSPLRNLEALQWAVEPFEQGQPKERALHLEMRQSEESRALRHAFFAERAVARPQAIKGVEPRPLERIAIVGGGLMGAGIAAASLSGGLRVALIERDAEAAEAADGRVRGLLEAGLKRGRITTEALDAAMARLTCSADYGSAADAQLAVEAVFEDAGVKREVFQRLAAVMETDAILATNTSYIDPRDIFAEIANPRRCLGLHFFSPAHIMKLLEIVATPDTSAEVLATGFAFGRRLGKISVLSGICDGFIGNRMLAEYRRLAEYMLADGALPHEVDAAARDLGMPMGPFELQDLTGLQIAWANRKRQAAARDPKQRYETIADTLCEMDRLGQRSGRGWYRYEPGNRTPVRDPEVENLILHYSASRGIDRTPLSKATIGERIIAVLANEGARIVEEGIAESDVAIDVVQLQGYGFPRQRGGPMHLAGRMGWEAIARIMRELDQQSPGSWALSDRVAANKS